MVVDSNSVGDPARFLTLAELKAGLHAMGRARRDDGRVALLLRRGNGGAREVLERARLTPEAGIPADAWERSAKKNPQMQIATMQPRVAELIANGQPLTLFGDCLFLDLDLSTANLPVGSQLAVGGATLEVTPHPHNGCRKFLARFGADALRFVSMPELRDRNLRGIYLSVVVAGDVSAGDGVCVLSRA